jgi:hypothetical protein
MKRRIYKYLLELVDAQEIRMSPLSDFLSVGLDAAGRLALWTIEPTYGRAADCEETCSAGIFHPRTIAVVGTGKPLPVWVGTLESRFLGTVTMSLPGLGDPMVWHIFVKE